MSNPYLTKIFYFNAAHQYGHKDWSDEKNWEVFGPDSKIHGHNYTLEVMVTGEIKEETGFLVDLGHLKKIVKFIENKSDIEIFWFKNRQPSTENLVIFIWNEIQSRLTDVKLHRIRLHETPTIFTDYYGEE